MPKGPLTVLVVDNDRYVLDFVSGLLKEQGYDVLAAGDADSAMDAITRKTIDIVFSDIRMPGISGIELLSKIHALLPDTPVVLMTAYADLQTAIDAVKQNAFDFLSKPFNPDDLVAAADKAARQVRLLNLGKNYQGMLEDEVLLRTRELEETVASLRQTDAALRESEGRMRSILESVQTGIVMIDPETHRIVYANQVAVSLIGTPREEIIGSVCHKYICPAEKGKCPVTDLGQEVDNSERILLASGGGRIPIIKTVVPIMMGGRKQLLESFIDITDRKLTEERLIKAKEEWERTFDSIEDPIMILDTGHRIVKANRAMAEALGVKPHEAEGLTCYRHVHGTKEPPAFCPHARLLSDGKAHSEEVYEERLGGYYQVSVSPLYNQDGKLYGSVHIARDITERKRFEQEIGESEKRYRDLAEMLPQIVFELDVKGNYLFVNRYALEISGYTQDDVDKGLNALQTFIPEDRERVRENIRRRLSGEQIGGIEYNVLGKNGRTFPVLVYSAPILREDDIIGLRGIAIDITERKLAEQKISVLNRVYSMLSKINETIVRVRDRDRLFKEVCRIAVDHGLFRMAWVGLVAPESLTVGPAAFYGHEEGYLSAARISAKGDVSEGRGPIGTAIRTGRPFICNDIEHDEVMLPWRGEALKRGYRSSAAFPIKSGDVVTGTVNFYSSQVHFFDEEEVRLLEEVAEDISFAVEFMEKEEKRGHTERELKERVAELEKFYEMAVGRELKMKELKKEIERLKNELSLYRKGT